MSKRTCDTEKLSLPFKSHPHLDNCMALLPLLAEKERKTSTRRDGGHSAERRQGRRGTPPRAETTFIANPFQVDFLLAPSLRLVALGGRRRGGCSKTRTRHEAHGRRHALITTLTSVSTGGMTGFRAPRGALAERPRCAGERHKKWPHVRQDTEGPLTKGGRFK